MITMKMIKSKLEELDTKGYWGVKKDQAYCKITEPLVHALVSTLNLEYVWPDDSLNCAQSWVSFGDYKEKGFATDHEYVIVHPETVYQDWKGLVQVNPDQIAFVWDRTDNRFYKVEKRGSSWNHSENNTEPEVSCFGDEIYRCDIEGYNFDDIEWIINHEAEINQVIEAYYHKQAIEDVEESVTRYQGELAKREAELADLKIKHPRAWKQIEFATKKVDDCKKLLESAEAQLSKLTATVLTVV